MILGIVMTLFLIGGLGFLMEREHWRQLEKENKINHNGA